MPIASAPNVAVQDTWLPNVESNAPPVKDDDIQQRFATPSPPRTTPPPPPMTAENKTLDLHTVAVNPGHIVLQES